MNTAKLKMFAPEIRRQLMEAVERKLDFVLNEKTPDFLTTFSSQVASLREMAVKDRNGLVEQVAYTWFNRFTALRYIDAKGWHPFRSRILTSNVGNETQPEVLKLFRNGSLPEEFNGFVDAKRLNDLLDGRIPTAIVGADPQGEVYRYLVLAACRFYNNLLPNLFEKLNDETELLLPDDLLTEQSIVQGFRTEIKDEDCSEVEVLGWLYQFYISEKKEKVMANKSAVPTADIPAVTQLFTPHWIVRYMVENSLGRLWLLNFPNSKLREHMPYYIENESETEFPKIAKPEEIRLIDPASGSGHMLTYAFDLMYKIYEEAGYVPSDIPGLILKHNLHGVDICQRAGQLATLALVFKAREKSRKFFQTDFFQQPQILAIQDIHFSEDELSDYTKKLKLDGLFKQPILELFKQFENATTFGSLINPSLNEAEISELRQIIDSKDIAGELFLHQTHLKVLRVLSQAEMLCQRYQIVVANPPYLSWGGMNLILKEMVKNKWISAKHDLYAVFILRSVYFLNHKSGFLSVVAPFNWMFIGSFEAFRSEMLSLGQLASLVQLEYNAFEPACVPVAAFTINAGGKENQKGVFISLSAFKGYENQSPKTLEAIKDPKCSWRYVASTEEIRRIPGAPIAYWVSPTVRKAFERKKMSDVADVRSGLTTGDKPKFVRFWYEVPIQRIVFGVKSLKEAESSNKQWFPFNAGGSARKWYGNFFYVINWKNDGLSIKQHPSATIRNPQYYFRSGVTWTDISSSFFCSRYLPEGFIFENTGSTVFPRDESLDPFAVLAFMCSKPAYHFMNLLNPTMHFGVGEVNKLPFILDSSEIRAKAQLISDKCIAISKFDWDSFETSWEFNIHPILSTNFKSQTLEKSWINFSANIQTNIKRMQELEVENNRLFIEAYNLSDEMSPDVSEDQITLPEANVRREVASFLSYAVGCMMGRFSLDRPGLILANQGDTLETYLKKVEKPLEKLTFVPDEDGIIPILDSEWFEDDIVARTRDFLKTTFGEATLRENLRFIEESLGKDLRKYFLTDFYKDHLQAYKKRPIYWMIQSPKKGFSVLIYLHRYTRDTLNLVLNRYLREYQVKLRNRAPQLSQAQANAASAREKTEARKEFEKNNKILHECEEWERQTLLPLAQARIELDLDDGVKINYFKLGEALAPIAGMIAEE